MTTGAVHVLYTACTYCGDVSTWQSGTLTISIHIIWRQEVSQSVSPQSHLCLSHPWSNTMVQWHLPLTHHKSTEVWQTLHGSASTQCVWRASDIQHTLTGCLWASEGWHWCWDDMPISLGWIQMSICRLHGCVIKSRDVERLCGRGPKQTVLTIIQLCQQIRLNLDTYYMSGACGLIHGT